MQKAPRVYAEVQVSEDPKWDPVIIDPSVLTKRWHAEATMAPMRGQFYLSATLHSLLYKNHDPRSLYEVLNYFRPRYRWIEPLPIEKLLPEVIERMKPYKFKEEFVSEIRERVNESHYPPLVREVILDEWSFLRENSSALMASWNFAKIMQDFGVAVLDATNRVLDAKTQIVQPYRGLKWFLAIALAGVAVKYRHRTNWVTVPAVGALVLAVFDP